MLSKIRGITKPLKGNHHRGIEQESSTPSTPWFETPIHDHFVSPGWMYRNVERFSTPTFQTRESPTKVADQTIDAITKGHEFQKKDNHKPSGCNIYMSPKDKHQGVQLNTSNPISPGRGEQNVHVHISKSRFHNLRQAFAPRNRKAGSDFTPLQKSHSQRGRVPGSPVILRKPVCTQVQHPDEVSLLPEEDSAIQWVMSVDSPTSGTSGPTAVESDGQSLEISEDIPSSDEILAADEPSYGMALRDRHGLRQPGYLQYNSFFQEYCEKAGGSNWTVDTHDSNWISFGPILRRRPGPRTPFRHGLSGHTSLKGMYRGIKGRFETMRSKMKRW